MWKPTAEAVGKIGVRPPQNQNAQCTSGNDPGLRSWDSFVPSTEKDVPKNRGPPIRCQGKINAHPTKSAALARSNEKDPWESGNLPLRQWHERVEHSLQYASRAKYLRIQHRPFNDMPGSNQALLRAGPDICHVCLHQSKSKSDRKTHRLIQHHILVLYACWREQLVKHDDHHCNDVPGHGINVEVRADVRDLKDVAGPRDRFEVGGVCEHHQDQQPIHHRSYQSPLLNGPRKHPQLCRQNQTDQRTGAVSQSPSGHCQKDKSIQKRTGPLPRMQPSRTTCLVSQCTNLVLRLATGPGMVLAEGATLWECGRRRSFVSTKDRVNERPRAWRHCDGIRSRREKFYSSHFEAIPQGRVPSILVTCMNIIFLDRQCLDGRLRKRETIRLVL